MNLHLRTTAQAASGPVTAGRRARYILATVRLVNGAAATLAPVAFSKRMGVDASKNPEVIYPLRMFGLRTLLIGGDLLFRRGDGLRQSMLISPAIHAADASAAILAGVNGHLPRKTAATGAAISTANLVLALTMARSVRRSMRAGRASDAAPSLLE